MDDNIHTSVVIELASQEEIQDRKTYKIDFNEEEAAKDYVIDQIFCGENITVYALFEVPEVENNKREGGALEIPNPTNRNDEYRFIHKNSFKKSIQKRQNGFYKQLSVNTSEDDENYLPNSCIRNQSFHCLKHLSENYEIPTGDESETELKVLFKNNLISKVPKLAKFKAVSKGVNTEIAQSPKLIEEVQRAVTLNFLCGKNNEKFMEMSSLPSGNPSYEITDEETRQSLSSFGTDVEIRKTSPDFLFVPLLMMEDKTINNFRHEKAQPLFNERSLIAKTRVTATKVSLGTNTDILELSNTTFWNEEKREMESCYSSQCEGSQTIRSETTERKNKKSNTQSQLHKKDKDCILNEIKKLQSKLSALIKSIEYSEVYLSTNEDEDFEEVEKEASKEVTEKLNRTLEPANRDQEQFQRINNKFDDIPIFSPLTFPKKNPKPNTKKMVLNVSKTKIDVVKSLSTDFIPQKEEITTVQNATKKKCSKLELKNIYSGININWDLKESWKNVGASKSDANNRVFFVPKFNCVKKSLSFDLRDDKMETLCLKKLKNTSFKLEGSVKANMRITQNGEVRLGDNIASIAGEMGDEASRKSKISKTILDNINQNPEKDEIVCMKNSRQEMQKILNEDEGDAKCLIPNQNLISQNFPPNPTVMYCSNSTIVTDELLKSMQSIDKGKSKVIKMDDVGSKAPSDPEKPTTSNKAHRKSNTTESELKKEVKTVKKINIKNKNVEKKLDKKEAASNEANKQKLVSGCRKLPMKSTAESKLHIDKLIKGTGESELKLDNISVTSNPKTLTRTTAEKQGSKASNKLPRPHSQKRDVRETITEVCEKEIDKKLTNKKPDTPLKAAIEKRQLEPEVTKNFDTVAVSENKLETLPENDTTENSAWLSTNPSSVVVELFSKKPTSVEEFYTEVSQEPTQFLNAATEKEQNGTDTECGNEISINDGKPIVKSVWALTKVLLFEDGSKKLEVLEASLTPPGFSLKPKDQN